MFTNLANARIPPVPSTKTLPMPIPTASDTLFSNPLGDITGFRFDENVVNVFPDMIKRSVPGYTTIISMIGNLAKRYTSSDTHCYDLGCSLGAATLSMRHQIQAANCDIIAVDNSSAMIERCQTIIDADNGTIPVQLICDDLQNVTIEKASVVVLNFTLQFISPAERKAILEGIYRGLKPGGVLILSEKVTFGDKPHDELMIDLYHNFKRANGYSELEVAQKRTALENVLIPETLDTHRNRLKSVGFSSSDVWFQCFNFASLIAIK